MEVLDKLIEYMGTHSIAFVISALVLYGFWKGMNLAFTVLEDKYAKKKHDKAIDKRNAISPIMDEYLKDLRLELNVCRSYIFEFHNGTQSLGGLPFLYMSNTYESCDPRINSEKQNRQHMPFSLYRTFITAMQENKTVYLDVDDRLPEVEPIMYDTLILRGTKKSIRTAIYDRHGRMIGYLGVDYCELDGVSVDPNRIQNTIKRLEDMAPRLSEHLVIDK